MVFVNIKGLFFTFIQKYSTIIINEYIESRLITLVLKKGFLVIILFICMFLSSCVLQLDYVSITNGEELNINVGENIQLSAVKSSGIVDPIVWSSESECISIDKNGLVKGLSAGVATVYAKAGLYADTILINVLSISTEEVSITLVTPANNLAVGDIITLEE